MGTASLSPHDSAIWHTVDIIMRLDTGTLRERPQERTSFPLAPGDMALTRGPFTLHHHAAPGDGSYQHNSGFFFATGKGGLAVTAAVAAGRALGNSRRRANAARETVPRWVPLTSGDLTTAVHGFHLQQPSGVLLSWHWGAISSMDVMQAGYVHLTGRSDAGPVSWVLQSDWAELVFVLWCRFTHPNHPQLLANAWIDTAWADRVRAAGYPLPERSTPRLGGDA